MGRMRFIKEQDPDNRHDDTTVTVETDAICLGEILSAFQDFLRGCGFGFDGNIEIVDDDVDGCSGCCQTEDKIDDDRESFAVERLKKARRKTKES